MKNLKGKKAIIVSGGSSMRRGGFLQDVEADLKEGGFEVKLFEGVESDPSIETVMKGAEAMREFEPDWIIAIGGGSPIDAAKAMWVFYEYPEESFDNIIQPFSFPELRQKAHFCAISSTSGTATEVTAFSVITDYAKGIKYPLADFNITPDVAHRRPRAHLHHARQAVRSHRHGCSDPLHGGLRFHLCLYVHRATPCTASARSSSGCPSPMLATMRPVSTCMRLSASPASPSPRACWASFTPWLTRPVQPLRTATSSTVLLTLCTLARSSSGTPRIPVLPSATLMWPRRSCTFPGETNEELIAALVQKIRDLNDQLNIPQSIKDYANGGVKVDAENPQMVSEEEFLAKLPEIAANAEQDACTPREPA